MNILSFSQLLAQTEDYEIGGAEAAAAAGALMIPLLIGFAFLIVIIAAMWKIFTKAGKPGWACLVPFYNIFVLLEIVGRPAWWFVLMLIPGVNVVVSFIVAIDLAKSFGQSTGFGIGLIFVGFIFYPILGFGAPQYVGPAAADGAAG